MNENTIMREWAILTRLTKRLVITYKITRIFKEPKNKEMRWPKTSYTSGTVVTMTSLMSEKKPQGN